MCGKGKLLNWFVNYVKWLVGNGTRWDFGQISGLQNIPWNVSTLNC